MSAFMSAAAPKAPQQQRQQQRQKQRQRQQQQQRQHEIGTWSLMQIVQHRYDKRGHDNGACLVAVVVGFN